MFPESSSDRKNNESPQMQSSSCCCSKPKQEPQPQVQNEQHNKDVVKKASCCGGAKSDQTSDSAHVSAEHDPVCGMVVSPSSPHHHDYQGKTYHFCSAGCLSRFADTPAQFLDDQKKN